MRPWARAARLCPLVLVLCASACTTRAQAPPQPAPTPAAPCAAGLRQATFRSTLRAAEGLTVVLTLCPAEGGPFPAAAALRPALSASPASLAAVECRADGQGGCEAGSGVIQVSPGVYLVTLVSPPLLEEGGAPGSLDVELRLAPTALPLSTVGWDLVQAVPEANRTLRVDLVPVDVYEAGGISGSSYGAAAGVCFLLIVAGGGLTALRLADAANERQLAAVRAAETMHGIGKGERSARLGRPLSSSGSDRGANGVSAEGAAGVGIRQRASTTLNPLADAESA